MVLWRPIRPSRTNTPKICPFHYRVSSVRFSRSVMSDSLLPHESQHAMPPCPSPTPRVHSNSCPSSRWCHPAISSSVVPFSSCPQSLPASESFPVSQLFKWGGQSIIIGDWNAKVGSQEISGVTGKFDLGVQNEARQRLTEFCQENALVIANTFFQQHKILHMDITRWSIPKSKWFHSLQPEMEKLYVVSKNKTESWLWLRS